MSSEWQSRLQSGLAIPAHPLAITSNRKLDERRQRALTRYYLASGVGGLAVGVHTTQFAIRDPKIGLHRPVLELAAEEMNRSVQPLVRIAGVCGATKQAALEAELARSMGYHAALLSLAALGDADISSLIGHCQSIAQTIPLIGFYLQPSVGGRILPYAFWRQFAEIENVVAIKIAPFNRYQTLDVVRAVMDAGRDDIALYTGNDDNIVADLLTPFALSGSERRALSGSERRALSGTERRIVGGLLGHWSVWTKNAVECFRVCRNAAATPELLRLGVCVTDCNAAFFDAANQYRGCIAGLHEVLRRQGLLEGNWCLDEHETLGPGQSEEIDRVIRSYPQLCDHAFVAEHRDTWLSG